MGPRAEVERLAWCRQIGKDPAEMEVSLELWEDELGRPVGSEVG